MKLARYILMLSLSVLSIQFVHAQTVNPNYDAKLAAKFGADDYGMKPFILVILKSGANTDKTKKNEVFRGHLDNINRLVKDGKLIVAGPLSKNTNNYRGIFILDVPSKEEALILLNTDPAISADYLQAEVYQWYGSAALADYLDTSDKIWKFNP